IDATLDTRLGDPRLRRERLAANLGAACPARTWNHGLGLARGTWIVVLGDDDALGAGFLAEIRRLAAAHPDCDVLRCRLQLMDAAGAEMLLGAAPPELEPWWEHLHAR